MNPDSLRSLIAADPFRPFTMKLTDGRVIRVPHRNFVTVSGSGQSLTIFGATGGCETVAIADVASAEAEQAKSPA